MSYGLVDVTVGREPGGAPGVEPAHTRRILPLGDRAGEGREQGMETEPGAGLVDAGAEQVGPLQLVDLSGGGRGADQLVAEGSAEPVEQDGVEHEPAQLGAEPVEDLLGQVVGQIAVAATQSADVAVGIGSTAHGQGSEVDRRRPTFGVLGQRPHRGPGRDHALAAQQHRDLAVVEGQVGRPDLGDVPGDPEPTKT